MTVEHVFEFCLHVAGGVLLLCESLGRLLPVEGEGPSAGLHV